MRGRGSRIPPMRCSRAVGMCLPALGAQECVSMGRGAAVSLKRPRGGAGGECNLAENSRRCAHPSVQTTAGSLAAACNPQYSHPMFGQGRHDEASGATNLCTCYRIGLRREREPLSQPERASMSTEPAPHPMRQQGMFRQQPGGRTQRLAGYRAMRGRHPRCGLCGGRSPFPSRRFAATAPRQQRTRQARWC